MYAWYFYFGGQRSLRGHFRFGAKKLQEFLFPQLGTIEFFDLNWNNAFSHSIVFSHVYFFKSGSKVIKGSKGQIRFSMGRKMKLFQMAKITVSMCSTWIEMQKCPR